MIQIVHWKYFFSLAKLKVLFSFILFPFVQILCTSAETFPYALLEHLEESFALHIFKTQKTLAIKWIIICYILLVLGL